MGMEITELKTHYMRTFFEAVSIDNRQLDRSTIYMRAER